MTAVKRTQIQLDEKTYAAVRHKAFALRRSMSAVVRETLAAALKVGRTPATVIEDLKFVGAGRSRQPHGRPVSERHDAALAEAFAGRGKRRR